VLACSRHAQARTEDAPERFPDVTEELPHGVRLLSLEPRSDERGSFTEMFRRRWIESPELLQWNLVRSRAGVLRGVHVHPRHHDYLVAESGRSVIGLRDLRRESPTYGVGTLVTLDGDTPRALHIPPGVAHGFLFLVESTHIYGVSHYWDSSDELGCRFDDPLLNLPWPIREPQLSPRDLTASSLAELLREIEASG